MPKINHDLLTGFNKKLVVSVAIFVSSKRYIFHLEIKYRDYKCNTNGDYE